MPLIRLHELKAGATGNGPATGKLVLVNTGQIQVIRPARMAGCTVLIQQGPTIDVAESLDDIENLAVVAERLAR